MAELSDYMGLTFEAVCRDWVRQASAAGALPVRVGRVGTWWNAEHQIDVVGLDERRKVGLLGEAKWRSEPFDWQDLGKYLDHVQAIGDRVKPDVQHILFSRSGFKENVQDWSARVGARLLTPADLLAPFP